MFTACCLLLQACGFGPGTITIDRFNYNDAVTTSWKEQTLANIIKIRYADMPVFIEIAQINQGYTIGGTIGADTSLNDPDAQGFWSPFNLNAGASISMSPNITYRPITGEKFNKAFMTPIPPKAALFLAQTGWPIELIFPILIGSINGLRAPVAIGAEQHLGDPEFYALVDLLRDLQRAGALEMNVKRKKGDVAGEVTTLRFVRDDLVADEKMSINVKTATDEIYRLLGLDPKIDEFEVVFGTAPQEDNEIAIHTLSMLQILIRLSAFVEVPPEDIESGSVEPASAVVTRDEENRLIRIRQSGQAPDTAFVSVPYRGRYYWIDDTDYKSKQVFTFIMILFSLAETGGDTPLPVITIPAG